jgi:hypothetical protein
MKYAFALALLVGCGNSAETTPNTSADSSVSETAGDTAAGSYSLQFGPITINPGIENTQCVVKRLGNPERLRVNTVHNVLGGGSHHLVVYRVNDTEERLTPFDCQPFTDTLDPAKGSTLMITQKKDDTLKLPAGVAYTLDANQMIRLEVHYINPTKAPIELKATSTMIPIADADFKFEADFLFIGTPDISLPPNKATTIGPTYFKVPDQYVDAKFFAITGHEHHYGTNVTVNVASSATDPGTSVYNVPDWKWDEPATVQQEPPFTVPAGGGFRFTCDYNNTTNGTVGFGESANQEMCFFWAYYYPSKGAKVCMHTTRGGSPLDFCCPGSAACSFFK